MRARVHVLLIEWHGETCTPPLLLPCVRCYHNSAISPSNSQTHAPSSLSVHFPHLRSAARGNRGGSHCSSCPLTAIRVHVREGESEWGKKKKPRRVNACDLVRRTKPPATWRRGDHARTNMHTPTTTTTHPPTHLPPGGSPGPRGLVVLQEGFLPAVETKEAGGDRQGDPGPSLQSRRKRRCCLFLWRVSERVGDREGWRGGHVFSQARTHACDRLQSRSGGGGGVRPRRLVKRRIKSMPGGLNPSVRPC